MRRTKVEVKRLRGIGEVWNQAGKVATAEYVIRIRQPYTNVTATGDPVQQWVPEIPEIGGGYLMVQDGSLDVDGQSLVLKLTDGRDLRFLPRLESGTNYSITEANFEGTG